jgi:hypothetical protein
MNRSPAIVLQPVFDFVDGMLAAGMESAGDASQNLSIILAGSA